MDKNNWCKGDFARHSKMHDWGIGIVVENQRSDKVSIFFENVGSVKILMLNLVELTRVDDPGAARLYLENALIQEPEGTARDRQPFPIVLQHFLQDFPNGFRGEMLKQCERNYKYEVHEWMLQHLDLAQWQQALNNKGYDNLASDIKRLYGKTNLLASFEAIKINEAFKDQEAKVALCNALFDLLYGTEPIAKRFKETATILARYELDKWPIITYPLFIRFPKEHMFIKPTMTQEAALNRGFDIQYSSQINWSTYTQVLRFSEDLDKRLSSDSNPDLHPQDMIDIQSFMWCTFGNGWSRDDIRKEKSRLGLL